MKLEQIFQNNARGGKDTNNAFSYSGSWDVRLKLDTGRMGLWPGGLFELHAESFFGDALNRKVGSLVNDDALFPEPGNHNVMLSHVTYTQFLSEWFGVIIGKLDTTTGDQNEFAWINGNNFLNTNLRWNPVSARTTPYSTLGLGAFIFGEWGIWSFSMFDTEGLPDQAGFDTVFDGGTTFATEARLKVNPFDLPGHQTFGFVYSDKLFLSLDQDLRTGIRLPRSPILNLLTLDLAPERESGSWAFFYNFDQYLYTETDDPTQGIGIFGRFGISDGEANPIGTFYSIGLGGKGIIPERDDDTYGLGYYYVDFEGRLPERLNIHSTQGVELFYNIELTPWMHLTPDLQVIVNPGGDADRDVAIVAGLRLQMTL
jgi:porin